MFISEISKQSPIGSGPENPIIWETMRWNTININQPVSLIAYNLGNSQHGHPFCRLESHASWESWSYFGSSLPGPVLLMLLSWHPKTAQLRPATAISPRLGVAWLGRWHKRRLKKNRWVKTWGLKPAWFMGKNDRKRWVWAPAYRRFRQIVRETSFNQ